MAIAFFDVDKTVLSVNSASLWIRRELRLGHITRVQALRAAIWVGLYGLGFVGSQDLLRHAIKALRGRREREIIDRTLDFWREEVATTIRPGARAAIARHREQGDLCFLLTSSSNYMCAPIADELKMDGFLANRFVVEGGMFTGEAIEPVCYGPGKVAHAEVCAQKLNVELSKCTFYSDSASDLPMMLAVGTPVVVNPDPRLSRIARKKGWPVEDWGSPTKLLTSGKS
jgi:HAD superfamily hydrolase (TIGR01490 family)